MIKKIKLTDAIKDNIISSSRIFRENILPVKGIMRIPNVVYCSQPVKIISQQGFDLCSFEMQIGQGSCYFTLYQ